MKYFDIFSLSITLNHQGNNFIRTNIGGFFSLLCIISIIIASFLFGKNVYYKLNPKVFHKYFNNLNRSILTIDEIPFEKHLLLFNNPKFNLKEFPDLYKFYNNTANNEILLFSNNSIINNTILSPILEFKVLYNNKINPIVYTNCPIHNPNFFCVNFYMPKIGGGNSIEETIDLKFILNLCTGTICLESNKLKNIFEEIFFIRYGLLNTKIQLDNYTHPYEMFEQYFSTPIKFDMSYLHNIYLDKVIIETDDNLLFSNTKSEIVFEYNYETIISGFTENKTESIIAINMSNKIQYYKRTYEKIHETFGGIYKFLLLFFGNVYSIFSRKLYYKEISNNIWIFDENMNTRKVFITNRSHTKININSFSFNKTNRINDIKQNIHKKLDSDKKNVHLDLKDIIMLNLCHKSIYKRKLKLKDEFLSNCKIMIDKCLDGVNIIKRIIEIDSLKWILFDNDQLQSLNYIFRSKCRIDDRLINTDCKNEPNLNLLEKSLSKRNVTNSKIFKLLHTCLEKY